MVSHMVTVTPNWARYILVRVDVKVKQEGGDARGNWSRILNLRELPCQSPIGEDMRNLIADCDLFGLKDVRGERDGLDPCCSATRKRNVDSRNRSSILPLFRSRGKNMEMQIKSFNCSLWLH
jgi:hypothetical protein